jgi:hypothetical protein
MIEDYKIMIDLAGLLSFLTKDDKARSMLTWQNISQSFRLIHMTQTTADNTQ